MMTRRTTLLMRGARMAVPVLVLGIVMTAVLPTGRDLRVSTVDAARSLQALPNCRNVQLVMQPRTSQGAAGTIEVIYRIHNLSGQTCSLRGYPGVQLLDRNFLSLHTTVRRGGSIVGTFPPRFVRLAARGNAYFALAYSDVPVGNRPCQATAFYLMIWAPNDFLPVVTHAFTRGGGIMACTGDISVSPVTAQPRFR